MRYRQNTKGDILYGPPVIPKPVNIRDESSILENFVMPN